MDATGMHGRATAEMGARVGGSGAMRRKACSDCRLLAIVQHGRSDHARNLCYSCMDARGIGQEEVVHACTVEGCQEAPAFIVEERHSRLVRYLLCRQHFGDYTGFFSRVFVLTGHAQREDCDPNETGDWECAPEAGLELDSAIALLMDQKDVR